MFLVLFLLSWLYLVLLLLTVLRAGLGLADKLVLGLLCWCTCCMVVVDVKT